MKTWMIIALAIIFMGGVTYLGGQACELDTSTTSSSPRTPTETSEPETEPQTFAPIIITGVGDKTSPPFTVTTDEWIIDWSYVPDPEFPEFAVFGFFIYPRGETVLFVESVLFPGNTSGTTYSYAGAGEYYIETTAANLISWQVVIRPAE